MSSLTGGGGRERGYLETMRPKQWALFDFGGFLVYVCKRIYSERYQLFSWKTGLFSLYLLPLFYLYYYVAPAFARNILLPLLIPGNRFTASIFRRSFTLCFLSIQSVTPR